MSSTEFDLTVPPSAEQIRKREFATVRRGYDADQVRDYLKHIADQLEKVELQVHDAQADSAASSTAASDATAALQAALDRARVAERDAKEAQDALARASAEAIDSVDPYSAFGEKMAEMLRSAESDAAQIRAEADSVKARAEMDARAEADRITTDAQARAEALRTEAEQTMARAQEEADRLLAGLRSKKASLRADLEHMRERLLAMADSLESFAGAPEGAGPQVPGTTGAATGTTKFFSEEQLTELWAADEASGTPPPVAELQESPTSPTVAPGETQALAPAEPQALPEEATPPPAREDEAPKFFSEDQLNQLWAADEAPHAPLTDVIDAAMADVVEAPSAPAAVPPVHVAEPPIASADSPFFVDETTRPDEEPGTGLYPR